jgi:uncharacterized protein (DUF58 family)
VHTLQEIAEQHRFGRLELLATQVVEGFITGLHRSPYHGFSVEFVEHRMYNSGESKKHVDWKLYAKTDKLYVKKYEDETNLRCQLVIDISSSMYFPEKQFNKLQFSVFSSAALMQLMKKQRDAAGLTLFSDTMDWHANGKLTQSHQKRMFLELENLLDTPIKRDVPSSNTANILHDLAERLKQRSLVILFSDMFSQDDKENLFEALQHLRFKKHELIIFHVTDPNKEKHLDFSNRPHRFVDIETGQEVKLNPTHIQDAFKSEMEMFYQELKLKCNQYKIDFVEADINQPFSEILNEFLIKRQRLY